MVKIAFGYKMGSGKDTSVEYLIKKYGGVKVSFSEPLYDILHYAQKVCEFSEEKDRWFLQTIGTEWARNKNPDVWVNLAIKRIREIEKENINVYNSDIRFYNELNILKKEGFICVKINREVDREFSNHISENELDNVEDREWDYVIDNNGSLEDLYKKIDKIINI